MIKIVSLLAVVYLLTACGSKGPLVPLPPRSKPPALASQEILPVDNSTRTTPSPITTPTTP